MLSDVFSFSLFFIILRETLEAAIIVSVLLSFIDKNQVVSAHSPMKKMVWIGTGLSFLACLLVGGVIIGVWYAVGRNLFEENEALIEGVLMLIASVFITITGLAFAKGDQMYERLGTKMQKKVESALEKQNDMNDEDDDKTKTHDIADDSTLISKSVEMLFFWVPFVTILREGLEAVILMGGVSFSEPPSSIPLAALLGIVIGSSVGYMIHCASGRMSLTWFFVISSYVLFVMAAGFFAKSVFEFQEYAFIQNLAKKGIVGEAAEGAAPFPRDQLVWWFPYASEDQLFWGLLNTIFGFKNIGSVAYVISYCCYWLVLLIILVALSKSKSVNKRYK